MIRHARLTQGGSSCSSPSSSGTSTTTQPSRYSHHSRHSHLSDASRHASRRDGSNNGSQHGSQHIHHHANGSRPSRSLGIPIPYVVPKFKREGPVAIKMWIEQMEYYISITRVQERKHVHFPFISPKCNPTKPTPTLSSAKNYSNVQNPRPNSCYHQGVDVCSEKARRISSRVHGSHTR